MIDLLSVSSLEEQSQRLGQIGAGLFDRVTLAGYVELRATGDVAVPVTFDDGGEAAERRHASVVAPPVSAGGGFRPGVRPTPSSSLLSEAISRQNEGMAKRIDKPVGRKNGHSPKPPVTPLGKELQKLRDKYIASGGKLLNRRELEREVAERRGLR